MTDMCAYIIKYNLICPKMHICRVILLVSWHTCAWCGSGSRGQRGEEEALHLAVGQCCLHELLARSWDDGDPLRYDLQLTSSLALALNHHRQSLLGTTDTSLPINTCPGLLLLRWGWEEIRGVVSMLIAMCSPVWLWMVWKHCGKLDLTQTA